MYKVVKTLEFTHTVPVMVPTDGGHTEQQLKVRYRIVPGTDNDGLDLSESDGMLTFLKKVIVSIEDLVDEQDHPIPYNNKVRDQLLEFPFIRVALSRGWVAAVTKAKAGN